MKSLAMRVIRQMRNDKRSLAMILLAPLLVLTLLSFLLGSTSYVPVIAVTGNVPPMLLSALEKEDAHIISYDGAAKDFAAYLKANTAVDALLDIGSDGITIYMPEASSKAAGAMAVIHSAMSALNPGFAVRTVYVYGGDGSSSFQSIGYVFLGLFSFFFVFLISGFAFVRERSGGTLERMLMAPIRRFEVILGYTMGYGIFAVFQSILMVLFAIYILGLPNAGNPLYIILIMLLMAITAVAFGAMISVFSESELQVVQFIPIAIIPQVFFSGLIPLETIPFHLGNICYITPVYYACTALKRIMIEGQGLSAVWSFALALIVYSVFLCVLNTLVLKKYRRL